MAFERIGWSQNAGVIRVLLLVCVSVLTLAACTAGSEGGEEAVDEAPGIDEADNSSIDDADNSSSDPESSTGPPSLEEELERIVRTYELTDLPDVTTVRTVTPEERDVLMAECMAERGFPQQEDGGYHFEGASQAEPFGLAIYECTIMYPLDDLYRQPLTEAQLALVYEHMLETMIPCYEDNDWPIDSGGVPSQETYIATWGTSQQWIPDMAPVDMDEDEVSRISVTCSWSPPSEELYAPDLLEGS